VGDEGREGVVHRIDRNTTGVLVLAKDVETFKSLKKQFHDHTLRKVYRAIVEGNIRHDTGIISLPLARAKSDFRKRTVVDAFAQDTRGEEREAITRYKVLDRAEKDGKFFTYVEVYPLTGRTHQIRAHFRAIRHPIIGDDLYGSRNGKKEAERSMLHAYSITLFLLDDDGKEVEKTVVSAVPKDMQDVLKKIGFSKTS
jgi:23S rRNA pseudouridine1911/1915/1917 synthase